ncbi:crotonase/enoyl-CoA hydratase family protein [Oceanicola sp. S124]|uniref:crotonase/enoyl-CoA hydratase family protein n=1 Tax=Oceanicola sp. S124 TaxID=1042378 RepID=UPI00025585FB|nr:crotonase/enoyl-CoA hydratase family protein [Oceanicola sp. S124]
MAGSDEKTFVSYEMRGDIAIIGLTRPEKRNAISDAVIEEFALKVDRASAEAKAAVIFGEGQHFCAGLDLLEHSAKPLLESVLGSRRWHEVFARMERGRIPFIAALHGAVVGGGFELASACHLRVADETTYFGLPEGQRGIFVGGGGSVRIERLIGTSRMTDMMLTGRVAKAAEMERWGGVNYVVEAGGSLDKAVALAEVTATNSTFSNYAIMNALPRIRDMSSEDGLFVESAVSALASMTPEAQDRLRAFLEKRAGKVLAN